MQRELDAEEQRRNELEAIRTQQELEAEMLYELPTEERRQELRGHESARELDVPKKTCGSDVEDCSVSLPPSNILEFVNFQRLTRGVGREVLSRLD